MINADTVHSLNLSTDLRYLLIVSDTINARFFCSRSHPIVSPDDLFNNVQTGISNHLDHMPILAPAHSNSAPLRSRL